MNNMLAYSNMGDQLKAGSSAAIRNSIIYDNPCAMGQNNPGIHLYFVVFLFLFFLSYILLLFILFLVIYLIVNVKVFHLDITRSYPCLEGERQV